MHDRTIVHEVLGLDSEQIFRQNDKFNGDTFAEYIKKAFGRALMIVDRAPQHRAGIVSRTLRKITDIRLAFIPAASPELRAIGECWGQSKNDLLSVSCVTMGRLRRTIDEYFASKTFGLDILRYLTCSLRGDDVSPKCALTGETAPDIPAEGEIGITQWDTGKIVPTSSSRGTAMLFRDQYSIIFCTD